MDKISRGGIMKKFIVIGCSVLVLSCLAQPSFALNLKGSNVSGFIGFSSYSDVSSLNEWVDWINDATSGEDMPRLGTGLDIEFHFKYPIYPQVYLGASIGGTGTTTGTYETSVGNTVGVITFLGIFGLNGTYLYPLTDALDVYGGGGLGFAIASTSIDTHDQDSKDYNAATPVFSLISGLKYDLWWKPWEFIIDINYRIANVNTFKDASGVVLWSPYGTQKVTVNYSALAFRFGINYPF
jgi:opacity protein-like surface antigen